MANLQLLQRKYIFVNQLRYLIFHNFLQRSVPKWFGTSELVFMDSPLPKSYEIVPDAINSDDIGVGECKGRKEEKR